MGMLFDHGSDACTALMTVMLIGRVLHIGAGIPGLVKYFLITCPFYLLNLQEYCTGVMDLPNLTGPDDSQLVISIILIAAGIYGTDFLT